MAVIPCGKLRKGLEYNYGTREHLFVCALLEGNFENSEMFLAARQLYKRHQRISFEWAREHPTREYIPLAQLPVDRRTWSEGEHTLITAILEGSFKERDLWSLRQAYDAFKQAMLKSDPYFLPASKTPQEDPRG